MTDDSKRAGSDELRQRLRALGYLNAPVDRFVLGGAERRGSDVAMAASASARIGLVAGILLGPASALGLLSRSPEFITSASDAVVVALYLAIAFGLASAVAAFALIVPASLIARGASGARSFPARARWASGLAGVLIFTASLAYLTLWWGSAASASGPPPVAWLVLAVVISLGLGHVVTVTALAVVARVGSSNALRPGVPMSSWRATAGLAAAAFVGAAALLIATAPGSSPAPASPALTVVPTGERVLVIAIDGLDLALVDRLRGASADALPAFSQLLSGASATLSSDTNRDPARVWTTIATGQPPALHGISALEGRQVAGVEGQLRPTSRAGELFAGASDLVRLTRPAIASGSERRIPTFWEVAARTGLRTSVIHWWATWPAATSGDDAGTVLSDRALLRLEHGGPLDGEIAPPALYDDLRATWPDRHARASARAATAVASATAADTAAVITRAAELDAMITSLAVDARLADVDLEVVYLPGLDIAQHGLLTTNTGGTASAVAARVQAIEQYYAFLDGLLGDLTHATDRTVVLVTEPGRIDAPGAGLLAVSGRPAARLSSRTAGDPASVAASVLTLLGVPVADDLSGEPLTELMSESFRRAHPVRHVATYGPRRLTARPASGKALDQEMIERMRSLGYIR